MNDSQSGDAATATAIAMQSLIDQSVDTRLEHRLPDLVGQKVGESLSGLPPLQVEVTIQNGDETKVTTLERQHYLFPAVLQLMACRDNKGNPIPLALVGPPGTGKTYMGLSYARATESDFVIDSFNPQTPVSSLKGYMDAGGNYVPTGFYRAFTEGLVYIADEYDRASGRVSTALNSAVGNRVTTFPDGTTREAHENFAFVATMNTYGTGGTSRFVADKQDESVLDRLLYLWIPRDEGLEAHMIGLSDVTSPKCKLNQGGKIPSTKKLWELVGKLRDVVKRHDMHFDISSRSLLFAEAMRRQGFGKRWILECALQRHMPIDQWNELIEEVGEAAK